MVKLTAELIEDSRQFINTVRDRELDLRGYKIPAIENLGATFNQFDTIDFSDNDIRKLDNFPQLTRVKCLFMNSNRITHIQPDIASMLPALNMLILTNNQVQELGDLDPLAKLKKLEHISLMGNPVTHKAQYRQYLVFKVPSLRVIDFRRIRQKERDEATALFRGSHGAALRKQVVKKTKAQPAADAPIAPVAPRPMPADDVQRIKEAITGAKSLAEVENLQQMLQSGQVPEAPAVAAVATNGSAAAAQEVEMDEAD